MCYAQTMRFSPLPAATAALALLSVPGAAQSRAGAGPRINLPPPPSMFGGSFHTGHHGFPGLIVVERQVPVVVEVPVAVPPPVTPPLPPHQGEGEKRKAYVIGASYASLPGGCMKLIEDGVSFYYCSGEWYRQVGEGRSATYKAVTRKL